MGMIQLKYSDLKIIRKEWCEEIDYICPILKKKFTEDKFVVDHYHALKSEGPVEETGKGCCRGVINYQVNAFEGKVTNAFKRCGLKQHTDIVSCLRGLADYLESNKLDDDTKFIHPKERPREPKLLKTSYNKLKKTVNGKQKVPNYNSKLTKGLEKLFIKYKVKPEFSKAK